MRDKRGQVHAVVHKAGFIPGLLEQHPGIGGSFFLDPFQNGIQLRADSSAKQHGAASFGGKEVDHESQEAAGREHRQDVGAGR